MFAPKIAKPPTKTAEGSIRAPTPQRPTLTIGNQATLRLVAQRAAGPTAKEDHEQGATPESITAREGPRRVSWDFNKVPVFPAGRTKLVVGEVNDPLEHGADRVADQVMRMPDPEVSIGTIPPQLSRSCDTCEEEDKGGQVLQTKDTGADGMATPPVTPLIDQVLASGGHPLDAAVRAFMESRFGHDFSKVRVHSGLHAEQSARDMNARAYTVGRHIVFAAGQFAPTTEAGRHLLAHELAHVVQQRSLGAGPMIQRKLECNVEPVAKECADATAACAGVKDYCTSKYPQPADIDKLHANAVRGATEMKAKFPNAAANLLHFLDASGTEKVMSSDLFRDHPATQQKYAEHMNKFLEGAKRRYDSGALKIGGPPLEMVWTDTANAFSFDYNDLGLAVGGYTLCSKASAIAEDPKKIGGSPDVLWILLEPWTVEAFDCYNWDPGKGIGLAFATDNDFCCLENAGRGKHFHIRTNPWSVSFQVQSVPLKETKPAPKPPPKSENDKSDSSSSR